MLEHASGGIVSMIAGSGPVVVMVLLVLILFSIISWAIIAWKFGFVRKSMNESQDFLDSFFDLRNADKLFAASENYRNSSLARVFRAGYIEYSGMRDRATASNVKERIMLAVKREVNAESKRLTHMVPFLATVGNTAPFIGLFGTVWGIMSSFQNIGLMKSASLAAVAPGISEALVATATGLVAAIPAVMGYNYLAHQIGQIERDMEDFALDFVDSYLNQ
ncbi:MAG TPA: protein TolQ [Chlorobaculum sp.]|jgi:biopolymer transport protein TolQ|uniref:ExbB/TolQ family protein n=1 Tax=Chlorobaculum tepidum (strain ATCC 49652 / DSM 12025 / NBRC 103806 / TLS) TaxID=194439 RepID=Q8KEQ3_CHLTE|nr:protein TolQ [Chlorobaculum tepidum]AAM71872.1 ExbB/TolQ family protein [Chlorobaculum tepidum TLS]HBU22842.1 protein TolQ [Chlorobaculum sp.]